MKLTETSTTPGAHLEQRVIEVGSALSAGLGAVLDALPDGPHGPQALATALGLDKVLTSRVLKSVRSVDPMAVVHRAPGPEPLRRLLRAAKRRGVPSPLIEDGESAVTDFERLIRTEAGDRSSLGAILAAWLPEARQEFELRRKQSAFKAMSQLKGVSADVDFSTVVLAPSDDDTHLDVVWVIGQYGVQRLRPGATVKFVTRRVEHDAAERRPYDLAGAAINDIDDVRMDQFCHAPPAPLIAARHGNEVQYSLGDSGFGPRSTVDVVLAEVNRREIRRYVPIEENRKSYVFAEVSTPVKLLVFDVLVHRDLYPGSEPELIVYDTHGNGIADPNDSSRDVDRFDTVEHLRRLRSDEVYAGDVPKHRELMGEVFGELQWDPQLFRTYRCRVEYPIYGSQLTVVFQPLSQPI